MYVLKWILIAILIVAAWIIYHRVMLLIEQSKLKPPGKRVVVEGKHMHVLVKGPNDKKTTLIFLGGYDIAAPIYHFKSIWRPLSKKYRIAVLERFGSGYSDFTAEERDIDQMIEEYRLALMRAGINPPYVLTGHAEAGMEVERWCQLYPNEVAGIIAIDIIEARDILMRESLHALDYKQYKRLHLLFALGFGRIPGLIKLKSPSDDILSSKEKQQYAYLYYRNTVNKTNVNIFKRVMINANIVVEAEKLIEEERQRLNVDLPSDHHMSFSVLVEDWDGCLVDDIEWFLSRLDVE